MSFKPGDAVIAQNLTERPDLNGIEGTVVCIEYDRLSIGERTGVVRRVPVMVIVGWQDGRQTGQMPSELRLKRPPSYPDQFSAGDWDLCPWQPSRERA